MSAPAVQLDTWGQAGHLNPAQEAALNQFREQVPDSDLEKVKFKVESFESVSLRYLRARQFDIPKAMQLLAESIKRRLDGRSDYYSQLPPDECANCDIEALKKWYPHAQLGYDKFNRPLLFEHSGAVDGNAIHQMTTTEGLINYHWFSMETQLNRMFEVAASQGPLIISTCVVLDLTGLSMHHVSGKVLDHVKAMVALDNTCYPETLGKMLVINAPWLAVTSYSLVKGMLDPRTQNKIEILGSGPDMHKRLLEFISPDNLPSAFGGTAPNLYPTRLHTEFLQVPRSSAIKKIMHVAPNKKIVIESYVSDGEINFECHGSDVILSSTATPSADISSTPTVFRRPSHGSGSLHNYDTVSLSEMSSFISSQAKSYKLLMKRELKSQGMGEKHPLPERLVVEYSSGSEGKSFAIFWSNHARMVNRPLIFNVVVMDDSSDETTGKESASASLDGRRGSRRLIHLDISIYEMKFYIEILSKKEKKKKLKD